MNQIIEILQNRVSVRSFTDDPVTDSEIELILNAGFRSPTSSNIQTYSVVVVRDETLKTELGVLTGNQSHVASAPVFLAFCADLTRVEEAMRRGGHDLDDNNLETCLVSSIDASLLGMSVYLAAESIGLKGVMIGGVRNNATAVAEVLGLANRVYCVFGMCLGRPAETPEQKPRMDYSNLVHHDRYDADRALAGLDSYDAELAEHYRSNGRTTTDDSWTRDMDSKFHPPLRSELRTQLRERGFDFS